MRKLLLVASTIFALPLVANAQYATSPMGTTYTVQARPQTYSAGYTGITPAASLTDFLTVTGSATRTIFIDRVSCTGTSSAAAVSGINAVIRSTADTGGTTITPSATAGGQIVPLDTNNVAASATVAAYTANPTTGTLLGVVRSDRISTGVSSGSSTRMEWRFGDGAQQRPTLRGVNQVFALSGLGTAMAAGTSLSCDVTWIEQ